MEQKTKAVKIARLTINIGGKTINITTKEAKELKEALDEIFPAQVEPVQIHWHHEPYMIPQVPYSPQWQFGASITNNDGDTCNAILNIEPEGNIII